MAESSVGSLVRELKAEVGLDRAQVMVPQTHGPAEEPEVDFREFRAVIAGQVVKLWIFVLRLSHSGNGARRLRQPGAGVLSGRTRARLSRAGRGAH